jgi:predicted GNAT family acetyltransferase
MLSFLQYRLQEEVHKDKDSPDFSTKGQLRRFKHGKSEIWYGTGTENHPHVEIASVRTPAAHRGQGHAGKALHTFLHHADKAGKTVKLLASPLDKRTKLPRLVKFYQKHGFQPSGSTGNAAGHPNMVRQPQTVTEALQEAKKPGFEVHNPEHFGHHEEDDDRFYHVTPKSAVAHIKKHGLKPRTNGGSMAKGFYADYSKGKTFFSDRSGVNYWHHKIGDHLEDQSYKSHRPKMAVLSFPKHWVKEPHKDELGTRDSNHPSHFVHHDIVPPGHKPDPHAKENLKKHFLFHTDPHNKKSKVLATSDSEEELKHKREALHQKGKYSSWHTKIAPSNTYEYHMNRHRD